MEGCVAAQPLTILLLLVARLRLRITSDFLLVTSALLLLTSYFYAPLRLLCSKVVAARPLVFLCFFSQRACLWASTSASKVQPKLFAPYFPSIPRSQGRLVGRHFADGGFDLPLLHVWIPPLQFLVLGEP